MAVQSFGGPAMTPWQLCMTLSQRLSEQQAILHEQQCKLQEQGEMIEQLRKQMERLAERVQAAETRPVYHIDKMEYSFDQLKVEKLDGTLNIGMTTPNEEYIKEIGQLVVPNQPPVPGKTPPPSSDAATSGPNHFPASFANGSQAALPQTPYPEIRQQVDAYLNQTAPAQLAILESEYGIPLDPYHRRLVIEDIRKQISTRIQYYIEHASQAPNQEEGLQQQQPDPQQVSGLVIQKTTRDINSALRAYMAQLQGNAGAPASPMNGGAMP